MTVITVERGYLESDYLEDPHLTGLADGNVGMQIEFNIVDNPYPLAAQVLFQIVDSLNPLGLQSDFNIINFPDAQGMQADFTIKSDKPIGQQVLQNIADFANGNGMQADFTLKKQTAKGFQADFTVKASKSLGSQSFFQLQDKLNAVGMQVDFLIAANKPIGQEVRVDDYPTIICGPGYLEGGYLEDPYLTQLACHIPGMQADFVVQARRALGSQAEFVIKAVTPTGMQTDFTIQARSPLGMQFESIETQAVGQQALATIYNTTNLRILCEFPSKGLVTSNWTATTTAAGDFDVNNVNSDIVEQVWRGASGILTGVRLDCDTGLPQGVFLDTLAILNHNFTGSANVLLIGSNDPTFGVTGVVIPLISNQENIYYIAPDLPTSGYRYWRIEVDDATNPDNYLEVGTILFGASQIFQGECFVDELDFQLTDYADSVRTEGFTNVSNSRALKRKVRLEFRFLNFQKNNFRIMRTLFETYRTTQKCLWIPTPSVDDPRLTDRFAAFAKLTEIPNERHRYIGGDADYVSFTIEVDESL